MSTVNNYFRVIESAFTSSGRHTCRVVDIFPFDDNSDAARNIAFAQARQVRDAGRQRRIVIFRGVREFAYLVPVIGQNYTEEAPS
jgi:hypothetical protein